jgi:hypothetical protein
MIEGDAESAEPIDAPGRGLRHERRDGCVGESGADAQRIGGMQRGGIVAPDRRGNAALSELRGAFADRAVRDQHAAVQRQRRG